MWFECNHVLNNLSNTLNLRETFPQFNGARFAFKPVCAMTFSLLNSQQYTPISQGYYAVIFTFALYVASVDAATA